MASASNRPVRGVFRIIAFLSLFVGVLYATDWAVNTGLRNLNTSAFGVSNRVMTGQANAEIVISGSSRALTHYDSRVIQEITGRTTFNIGRNGSQTDMQLAFLKTYLQHNAKPKLVIHNLDLFSFLTSYEIYDPAQYLPYLKEDAIFSGIQRVYPDAWKWRHLPLYGYLVEDMRFTWLKGLKGFVGLQPREDHHLGFLPRYSEWTGDFEKFRQAHPHGIKFELEPQGIRDLSEIAAICRKQGIPLLFVYSPEYIEMQALESNREEIFEQFLKICQEFGAKLWDYSASPISMSQTNFYNSQHLNAEGANAFSTDLSERLVKSDLLQDHLN